MTERERILGMVADGTITQEEADKLLSFFTDEDVIEQISEDSPEIKKEEKPNIELVIEDKINIPESASVDSNAENAPQNEKVKETKHENKTEASQGETANHHTQELDRIKGINISWISGPIEIRPYSGTEINVTEYCRNEIQEEDKMQIYEENGILFIKWNRRTEGFSLSNLFQMIGRSVFSKSLVVEIPEKIAEDLNLVRCKGVSSKIYAENFKTNVLKLESTSGSVDVNTVRAKEMHISSVSGAVRLDSIYCNSLVAKSTSGSVKTENILVGEGDFNSVSGGLHINGGVTALKANTVSGGIKSVLINCPERLDFSSVSGGQKLTLPENDGFTARYSTTSGKFVSEFEVSMTDKKNGTATYKNGASAFKLSSMSGSIKLFRA